MLNFRFSSALPKINFVDMSGKSKLIYVKTFINLLAREKLN